MLNSTLQSVLHCLRETFSRTRTAFLCSGGRVWTRDHRLAASHGKDEIEDESANFQTFRIHIDSLGGIKLTFSFA